jgi:hypothetical protein
LLLNVDIADSLRSDGFALVPGTGWQMSGPTAEAFYELRDAFNALPLDTYLPDHGRYRFRRYTAYEVPPSGDLHELPTRPYYQAPEHNALVGGIPREFAPLGPTLAGNAYLRALVQVGVQAVTEAVVAASQRWHVDVHLVRVVADGARFGKPSPEGPHRDGFDYVSIHLMDVAGVDQGGITEVLDHDGASVLRTRLAEPGDTIYLDDKRLQHDVSPIEASRYGRRDVILCSYRSQ